MIQLYKTFLVSSDASANIFFWPLKSRKAPVPLRIKKLLEISFFSFFANKMIVSGKDELKRDLLLLYDTAKIYKKKEIVHVCQQISDFDIKVIKFYEETKLISCGKDNIRLWNIKEDRLISISVIIPLKDQFSYTDIELTPKKAYVSSIKGLVIIINLTSKEVEASFSIHKGAITRLKIIENIVMTASDDTFVRLWPLDFSEVYMEIQHKSKICSIDILGNTAVSLTEGGILGLIDLQNNTYQTLNRSFFNTQNFAVSENLFSILHNTITILNNDFSILCEFSSIKDEALVTSVNPLAGIVCCGFFSGAVRLFDIKNIRVKDEFLHCKSPIEVIEFSSDGK